MGLGGISIWQILVLLLLFGILLLPCLMALFTKKPVSIISRFIWALSALVLSWIGYLLYYFVVVKKEVGKIDTTENWVDPE